ncbi:ParB/RepB/Spo0J family partition protein [Leucothrix arctica]|uniref:Probable chromosome-partitioning protein ParB n=1 Tax=Leucothrix arctica TaxID=1481894 RepID=A0A317CEM0_9GAMM|nr:ParB/RepB/Spo0J family partition protein [Leucothrix arctica]PWQ96837.1 chromosome partitioning protein ParB [Leucothrix arctica]
MVKKSGLGDRGLNMLLSSGSANKTENDDGVLKKLPVEKICRGEYQPRINIDPDALQELSESIKAQGLIQPIIVRRLDDGRYELIAGERRWRAAQMVGMHEIQALVRRIPNKTVAAMSLIENIQREDLNPLEEAQAINRLILEFGLTHQQTAESIGRSRSAISNALRLLDLEPETKSMLDSKQLNMGHARALLMLKGRVQVETAAKVASRQMSVRDTEKLVKQILEEQSGGEKSKNAPKKSIEVRKLEQDLADRLGSNVEIQYNSRGKGKLVIAYSNLDELDGILSHIQ